MSFSRIRDILPGALEGLGIAERVAEARAVQLWPDVAASVSPELARGSQALRLRDGVLLVRVAGRQLERLLVAEQHALVSAMQAGMGTGAVRALAGKVAGR